MNYEELLRMTFFQAVEDSSDQDRRNAYEEARSGIVAYAHSSLPWSEVHTGLTIIKAELVIMIELNMSAIATFAKGLLVVVEGMIRKLEINSYSNHNVASSEQTPNAKYEETAFTKSKLFKGQISQLGELISLIIKAVYPNGCSLKEKQYIVKGMFRLLGCEYDGKKWQNSIDGIRKRTPAGSSVLYYLDRLVKDLNNDMAA